MDIQAATGGLGHIGKNPVGQDSLMGLRSVPSQDVRLIPPESGTSQSLGNILTQGGFATDTHKLVRWLPHVMPLKISVAPWPPALLPWVEAMEIEPFERFVWAVLQGWVQGSDGRVSFEVRQAPTEKIGNGGCLNPEKLECSPHMEVVWTDTAVLGRPYEVGHTDRRVQPDPTGVWGGLISSATITLLSCPAIDGELTPQQRINRLTATLLHEVGHGLGLDHGQSPLDVMYYRGWQNIQLSNQDLAQLWLRYPRDGRREFRL